MIAVVLGSAFGDDARTGGPALGGAPLSPHPVQTPFGTALLHRWPRRDGAYVLLRHGAPHRYLPHQIPHRAHAWALRHVGVQAALLTSSVGVLDPDLPLFTPLLIGDLLMLENRLPGGGPCTMWPEPSADQGHLVLEEGLFSRALTDQVAQMLAADGRMPPAPVTFAFQAGPRTKTAAENRALQVLGAQVNSMSIGPEVVLLAELGVAVAAVGTGHKRSGAAEEREGDWVTASLDDARQATEALAVRFLSEAEPVPVNNRLYRFGG